MFWLIVIALIVLFFYLFTRTVEHEHPWVQGFDDLKFSSDDFYKASEEAIRKRSIPGIDIFRTNKSEGGVIGADREYLRCVRDHTRIDICAAPFGRGFFVSSWTMVKPSFITRVLRLYSKIPLLSYLYEKQTHFQMDCESMFKSFVHQGMLEAIDAMTTNKGVRALTEFERRMPDSNKK